MTAPLAKDGQVLAVVPTRRGKWTYYEDRLELDRADGSVEIFPRCPRCHRGLAMGEIQAHTQGHCALKSCPVVGPHLHCTVTGCSRTGTRHFLDHVMSELRLPDLPARRENELVRLSDRRPEIVEDEILEMLDKQGRTVKRANRVSVCDACALTIEPGMWIEAVALRDSPHVWIHVWCPTPASRRDRSIEDLVPDRAGPEPTSTETPSADMAEYTLGLGHEDGDPVD